MNRVVRASLVLALLSTACQPETPPEEPQPVVVDPCAGLPPLALSSGVERVRVRGSVSLTASGGSGHYRYRVEPGGSSGELRGSTFVAGSTPGTDTLVVEDQQCPGDATTKVTVLAGFDAAPTRATLRPGTSFQVEVAGLLGKPVFTLEVNGAGSSLSATGVYTAGPRAGLDLVRVRDASSGDESLLQFDVRADATLRGDPALVALPAGSSLSLAAVGGSDRLVWTKKSGPGRLEGSRFIAEPGATGGAVVEAVDRFTGQKTTVSVRVLAELTRQMEAHGTLTDLASVVTADFDGDGIADVAVGRPESDLARPTAGAVFIFKGSSGGLPAEPTWILTGETDTARFGDALVAGDLDKDGKAELAVSSPGADVTISDSGAVYLFRFGDKGPERMRPPLAGLGRGLFGAGMALADADGDGDLDLVVGSPTGDLATAAMTRGIVDIFLLTPGQAVPELPSIRLGGSDVTSAGLLEPRRGVELGRSLVVADLNGDGRNDIAALSRMLRYNADGTPTAIQEMGVAVHFARAQDARFRSSPDVYVRVSNRADSNEGTWKLDAVPGDGTRPPLLMVVSDRADSPDLRGSGGLNAIVDAGGVLLFDLSAHKPQAEPANPPVQVQRDTAFARLYGDVGGGLAGRSWAVLDVDDKPGPELLLGVPYVSPNTTTQRLVGKVIAHPLTGLTSGAQLNKPLLSLLGPSRSDIYGVGLAAWPLPDSAGLVVFAGRASAPGLAFTGRVDGLVKKGTSLADWTRTSVMVPARASVERFGEAVAVARGAGGVVALVGSPGFAGPGSNGDGNDLSAGRAWTFGVAGGAGELVAEGASSPLSRGRNVGTDVAFTDFNGDGRPDAVMGAPAFTMPGVNVRATEITPVYAKEVAACVPASSLGAGGVLVSLGQADGSFKPAYRLWAPGDIAGCTPAGTTCQRRSIGRGVVGGFDFNGDGKQDLGVLRNNGVEVFLGRAPDDTTLAKLTMACDSVYTAPYTAQQTSVPVAVGDLDGDKCDELAWRYSDGTRSGIVLLFGHEPAGGKCGGKTVPTRIRVAADGEVGSNLLGLGLSIARAGRVLGKSGADYLAVGATAIPFDGVTQQAVLLFDVAALVKFRPASGETLVSALDATLVPKVLVHRSRAVGFGAALLGNVDLTGDGVPELVVSAPGASVASDGGGAVFVYAGGPDLTGAITPLVTLTGDVSERANFGQDLGLVPGNASSPPMLVVGAPTSYRTGTQNGTAFLVPLGF